MRWNTSMFMLLLLVVFLKESLCENEASTVRSLEEDLNEVGSVLLRKIMPIASELATSPELSSRCSSSLFKTIGAIKRQDPWAIRMITANGLLPNNLLEGSLISLGGYEQCLRTRLYDDEGRVRLKGQYCSLFVSPPQYLLEDVIHKFQAVGEFTGRLDPLTLTTDTKIATKDLRLGICVPSECSQTEVNFLANGVLKQYGIKGKVKGCRTDDPKEVTKLQVASISYLGFLACLVVLGTLMEWLFGATSPSDVRSPVAGVVQGPLKVLLFFSAISNTRRLLRSEVRAENRPLLFLSGFKVLLIFWVVYSHGYVIIQPEFARSPFLILELTEKVRFQVVLNGLLSVSTFLFLSGFVMSFLVLSNKHLLKERNMLLVYIVAGVRRYVRLSVPVLTVVMAAFLLPLLADGPADQELMAQQVNSCATRFWTVILYVNNFNPIHKMCLVHLWYVSTDMQVFMVIALPLTLLFTRFRRLAIFLSGVIMLAFCILVSLQTHFWHLLYSATSGTNDGARIFHTLEYIYFRPFTHVATYVLGVITGFLVVRFGVAKISTVTQVGHWLLSLALTGCVLFLPVIWNRGQLPDEVTNSVYAGFHRLVWSIGLVWPTYACATGYGGLLNRFFSWTALIPLARLTYCIYLVHILFYLLRIGSMKSHINVSEYFQITTALGVFCLSVFFGYLLHLSCEAPVLQLEKMVFERPPKISTKSKQRDDSENVVEKSKL